jgi:hypothetical protein
LRLGQFQAAIDDANKGLHIAPGRPDLLFTRAYAEERTGDITDAIRDYKVARAGNPDIDATMQSSGLVPGSKTIAPKW